MQHIDMQSRILVLHVMLSFMNGQTTILCLICRLFVCIALIFSYGKPTDADFGSSCYTLRLYCLNYQSHYHTLA